MDSQTNTLPWLLQRNQLTLLAALLPPVALVVIYLNKHRLSEKTYDGERFFALLMTCTWLIKLLPHHWFTLILLILLWLFSFIMLIIKLLK